ALLRQEKDALAALRQAAELLPQDAEAHANLAPELHVRGGVEAALVGLRTWLTLKPRDPDVLSEAADVQPQLGRPREALTLYQWAHQADPRRGGVSNTPGHVL